MTAATDNSTGPGQGICEFCRMAQTTGSVPVIIFSHKDCKDVLRENITSLGGTIRRELKILGAFAVNLDSKYIHELENLPSVSYIYPDIGYITREDITDH